MPGDNATGPFIARGRRMGPRRGTAMIGTSEKNYLLSGLRLTSIEAKLNRAMDASEDGSLEAQRLDDCIHHVVEAENLLDALLAAKRHNGLASD